jgi:hypothetical protein
MYKSTLPETPLPNLNPEGKYKASFEKVKSFLDNNSIMYREYQPMHVETIKPCHGTCDFGQIKFFVRDKPIIIRPDPESTYVKDDVVVVKAWIIMVCYEELMVFIRYKQSEIVRLLIEFIDPLRRWVKE